MPIKLQQIHHVQITVPRETEQACSHFYGTVLGLKEIEKPDQLKKNGGFWYRHGDIELHVSLEDNLDNTTSKRHICYTVENLEETKKQLMEDGIEIIPDKQPIDGWLRIYVRDPGGNRVEIAQEI